MKRTLQGHKWHELDKQLYTFLPAQVDRNCLFWNNFMWQTKLFITLSAHLLNIFPLFINLEKMLVSITEVGNQF